MADAFCEVWSWGSNQLGQLGQGDTVARREPGRVRLPQGPVIKVCVGNDHNIALMATGEAYVWGSNANGQFKQMNHHHFTHPTLLKLGSESSILDVDASGDSTSVIVSGIGSSPTTYHFSRELSSARDSPTIHLVQLEAVGCPLKVSSMNGGQSLLVGCMPKVNGGTAMEDAIRLTTKLLQSAKMSVQLTSLLQKIREQSQTFAAESQVSSLLKALTSSLMNWSTVLSKFAENAITSMCMFGDAPIQLRLSSYSFQLVVRSLLSLHYAYIDAVAYGCFADVDISSDLAAHIERLSLEYEAESSKQHRRLKNLFHVPFDHFDQLKDSFVSVLVSHEVGKMQRNFFFRGADVDAVATDFELQCV